MPLDIGVGILLSLFTAHLFGVHPSPFFVAFGIICALLPDIDIIPIFWPNDYDHRSYPHYPIVYVPLTLIVYLLVGPAYAMLFALGVFLHLVHDTIGLGWGVAWFWPFSLRKFLFFPVARMQKYGFFMTWLPEAEKELGWEYHDPHWVRRYYLRPHPVAFIEYGVLLAALLALTTLVG